jgi:glycosyltransferase involved in cell wall biosynthesis
MKVALVHDFLNQYGGAERVLEALHEIYPKAPVYTSLYAPAKLPLRFKNWEIRAFRLPRFPLAKTYTFFYPLLFEKLDLSSFDLVISTSANFAKGVITSPKTVHLSYIHTPPRFLYHYQTEVNRRKLLPLKPILSPLDNLLRVWDFSAAQRPDLLVANSQETAKRIRKFYGREAEVIYPPVALAKREDGSSLEGAGEDSHPSYFLVVSRLAKYKRIDLAIEACKRLGLPLKIVGTGREEKRLGRMGGEKTDFLGFVSDRRLAELYRRCRALIFPGEEDFGITPVEAMSFGKPVIAFGKGGALETVVAGKTGEFFYEEKPASLAKALKAFDPKKYRPADCVAQAQRFSKESFQENFRNFVDRVTERN